MQPQYADWCKLLWAIEKPKLLKNLLHILQVTKLKIWGGTLLCGGISKEGRSPGLKNLGLHEESFFLLLLYITSLFH